MSVPYLKSVSLDVKHQRLIASSIRVPSSDAIASLRQSPAHESLAHLHEMISAGPGHHAAALSFALAAAAPLAKDAAKPILALGLKSERQERGCLYGSGIPALGLDPRRFVLLDTANEKDLLWAAEEGAACEALGAVVACLGSREKLYGFTASRRLKLRLQASGVPVFVVRHCRGEPTAATVRCRVAYAKGGLAVVMERIPASVGTKLAQALNLQSMPVSSPTSAPGLLAQLEAPTGEPRYFFAPQSGAPVSDRLSPSEPRPALAVAG
jgi:hypothetical protein